MVVSEDNIRSVARLLPSAVLVAIAGQANVNRHLRQMYG